MHATQVADELGITAIVVPPYAGSFSALGLLASDIRKDVVETILVPNIPDAMERVSKGLDRLARQAVADLAADGFEPGKIEVERSLDLRYKGQAFELNLPVHGNDVSSQDLEERFTKAYSAAYGHANEGDLVEIVNARVAGIARTTKPSLPPTSTDADALIERRTVWIPDRRNDVPVYDRACLAVGASSLGPAVIEETGSTTVVFSGWTVRKDDHDNLVLERQS
jgi:N-methylhydantoinase A/oxoprolinase/acetone carboxylase beta subunit